MATYNYAKEDWVKELIKENFKYLEYEKYYGSEDIVPTDNKYFIFEAYEEDGEIIGYIVKGTDEGKKLVQLVIPYEYEDKAVFWIGESGFANFAGTSIILPNTIYEIGENAFSNSSNLSQVTIPLSVESVYDNIFDGVENFTINCYPESYIQEFAEIKELNYTLMFDKNKTAGQKYSNNAEVFNDYVNNNAAGQYSHAEGYNTRTYGNYCHAEGNSTVAGRETNTRINSAHAEGSSTTASGTYSHAEGYKSTAYGTYSHAEGYGTYANGSSQHVQGKWNIIDSTSAYIVGNGTKEDVIDEETGEIITQNRSNAHTLDWDGNAWYAGKVTAAADISDEDDDYILINKKYLNEKLILLDALVNPGIENEGKILKVVGGKATWINVPTVEGVEV